MPTKQSGHHRRLRPETPQAENVTRKDVKPAVHPRCSAAGHDAAERSIPAVSVTMPRRGLMILRLLVNGGNHEADVEPRLLLSDFLRQGLGLTGTHVGCEHGVCGACTILFDGEPARSCIMLAVQADGHAIHTVESLSPDGITLNPLQQAFRDAHGLQCGFCTPGILMTLSAFLRDNPAPAPGQIRDALSANLCRCTGYQHIVEAVTRVTRSPLR